MSTRDELEDQVRALAARMARLEAEIANLQEGYAAPARDARSAAARTVSAERQVRARPSLESRIGSQLFNRIGILALLIGAAWFLKFAIDQRWIGPAARVLVGVGAGLGLVGWSEWFRLRGYRAFSYSLKALGTGVLYLSVWAAYTVFALVPASIALLAMVLITVTNAWLCWRQNSEVLAFYAALGGLLTPLLLWSAESQEMTLFGYLLLLDGAVLVLVAMRPWSRLLLVSFAGTAAYAVAWYVRQYTPAQLRLTAFFVVVFFLLFSAAPQLLRNLRLASRAVALTFEDRLVLVLLPLLNGLLAFAELYALLSDPVQANARAWVAFGFALFYLGMLWLAQSPRLAGTPARLRDTYLLLSVVAFTGALPLALSGRAIPVSWSAESIGLFLLALRSRSRMLQGLASVVLVLAFTATLTLNSPIHGEVRVLANVRFATYVAAVAAGVAAATASAQGVKQSAAAPDPARGWLRAEQLGSWGATILLMIGLWNETGTYWRGQLQLSGADRFTDVQFTRSAVMVLLGALLLAGGFWRKLATLRWQGLLLLALSIGKVFLFDLRTLSQGYRIVSFLGLGVLLVGVSFIYQRDLLSLRKDS